MRGQAGEGPVNQREKCGVLKPGTGGNFATEKTVLIIILFYSKYVKRVLNRDVYIRFQS